MAADVDQSELFNALVAAVGTDVGLVGDQVATHLAAYGYESRLLRLSDYLAEQIDPTFRGKPFDEELWEAMSAGDELRTAWDRSDALALHSISDIVATRDQAADGPGDGELPANLSRYAFILRSLKTPDELETLRSVYGPRLVVIAAYSPKELRLRHLAHKIEDSRKSADRTTWAHQPEELIERDEKEQAERGQDVSGTFHRADFFIRGWDREVIAEDLERTLEILFGSPFRTPTKDEHAQFVAAGAALRSAEFGRQVGASITTREGSLIALGANEVPKPRGGSHWEDEGRGNRDFEVGDVDTNRRQFDELARRLADRADKRLETLIAKLLGDVEEGAREALDTLREEMLAALPEDLRAAGLGDLTEFGRAVHAEMNALLDAARRGISVADSVLYTTTFPCHNCARHIIGAGVSRVVFIEPYAKSRAHDSHGESMRTEESAGEDGTDGRIEFEPFVGVAPRRFRDMFYAEGRERLGHVGRKDAQGRRLPFAKDQALPVFVDAGLPQFRPELREYRAKELLALEYFGGHMAGGDDLSEPSTSIRD